MVTLARQHPPQLAAGECGCDCGCVKSLGLVEYKICDGCVAHGGLIPTNWTPTLIAAALGLLLVGVRAIAFGGIVVEPAGAAPFAIAMVALGGMTFFALPAWLITRFVENESYDILPFAAPRIEPGSPDPQPGQILLAAPHPKATRIVLYLDRQRGRRILRHRRWDLDFQLFYDGRLTSHDTVFFDAFVERRGNNNDLHIFDILYLDGVLLTDRPYTERRALLAQALADVEWKYSTDHITIIAPAAPAAMAMVAVDARGDKPAHWRLETSN